MRVCLSISRRSASSGHQLSARRANEPSRGCDIAAARVDHNAAERARLWAGSCVTQEQQGGMSSNVDIPVVREVPAHTTQALSPPRSASRRSEASC